MMDIAKIDERLSKTLKESRYTHSVYVAHEASDMAERFDVDKLKAFVAGLLHDCAKGLSYEASLETADKYGYTLDDITLKCHGIIHADIGAILAEHEYGITDREMLDAIRYHTVARKGMTLLDKIIYVADMTEPNRAFDGVEHLRTLAKEDINSAFCEALKCSLEFNLKNNNIIHPNTLYAWNEMMIMEESI